MDTPSSPAQRPADAPTVRGIAAHLADALAGLRRLVVDHLELGTLEARRAALALVVVLAAAFGATVLALVGWLALVSLALVAWTDGGRALSTGLLAVAALHAAFAAALVAWIRTRLPRIAFPATVRQLRESLGEAP